MWIGRKFNLSKIEFKQEVSAVFTKPVPDFQVKCNNPINIAPWIKILFFECKTSNKTALTCLYETTQFDMESMGNCMGNWNAMFPTIKKVFYQRFYVGLFVELWNYELKVFLVLQESGFVILIAWSVIKTMVPIIPSSCVIKSMIPKTPWNSSFKV